MVDYHLIYCPINHEVLVPFFVEARPVYFL